MNRRRHLQLVALEARDVPAVALPAGLLATSGLFTADGDVLAGVSNGKPAYVQIDNGVVGSVTVLPSLSVAANGASGNPAGAVQDVIRNTAGETIFVGSSQSDDSFQFAEGEGTSWMLDSAQIVGYGYTGMSQTSVLTSSTGSVSVGMSSGLPVIWNGTSIDSLSNSGLGSSALSISSNSNYIVGVDGSNSVAWKKNTAGTYDLVALQAPTSGGPLGFMSGVVNNFAAGQYYDPISESEVGAIWNLDTGAMVRDFKSYGAVDSEVQFQQIGNEFVAVFSGTEGQSPLVHLFNADRTFPLHSLPSLGAVGSIPADNGIGRVSDIWERPDGSLGLSYLGTNGNWYYDSLPTNDRNEPWTTAPAVPRAASGSTGRATNYAAGRPACCTASSTSGCRPANGAACCTASSTSGRRPANGAACCTASSTSGRRPANGAACCTAISASGCRAASTTPGRRAARGSSSRCTAGRSSNRRAAHSASGCRAARGSADFATRCATRCAAGSASSRATNFSASHPTRGYGSADIATCGAADFSPDLVAVLPVVVGDSCEYDCCDRWV